MMNLILLGPPGAGKGTQAKAIAASTGSSSSRPATCCAQRSKAGTDIGRKAKAIMDKGDLVPDDVVVRIIAERLDRPDCKGGGNLGRLSRATWRRPPPSTKCWPRRTTSSTPSSS
jgi:adenylate kinase